MVEGQMLKRLINLKAFMKSAGYDEEFNEIESLIEKHSSKRLVRPEGPRRKQVFVEEEEAPGDFLLNNPSFMADQTDKLVPNFEDEESIYEIKAVHNNGVQTTLSLSSEYKDDLRALTNNVKGVGFRNSYYTYKEVYLIIATLIKDIQMGHMLFDIDKGTEKAFGRTLLSIPQEDWKNSSDIKEIRVTETTFDSNTPEEKVLMVIDPLTGKAEFPYGEDAFRRMENGNRRMYPMLDENEEWRPQRSPYSKKISVLYNKRMYYGGLTSEEKSQLEDLKKKHYEYLKVQRDEIDKRFYDSRYPEDVYENKYDKEIPIGKDIENISEAE